MRGFKTEGENSYPGQHPHHNMYPLEQYDENIVKSGQIKKYSLTYTG